MKFLVPAAMACLVIGCSPKVQKCVTVADCQTGQACVMNECRGAGIPDSGSGGSLGGTGGGSTNVGGGGGGIVTGCSPTAADNPTKDTDCDGLTDAEEYGTMYSGKQTDPCKADTDGDGITDGVELGRKTSVNLGCGFVADADPNSKTNPTSADTDTDGLKDGEEDVNHNGRRDVGETNPLKIDSDCDGYSDKEERDSIAGCATDPNLRDTDGDGLPDGVEGGLQPIGADGPGCGGYPPSIFDANPATKTNACNADTDSDGIQDGAEDTNKNGKVDPGELDPNNATDSAGPPSVACSTANLKPIVFTTSGLADVQMALVPEFVQLTKLADSNGERGLIFYDSTTQVAGLAISKTPAGADGNAEEQAVRALLGSVSAPVAQTYTTWDGFANSVRASYDVSGNEDVKTKINTIAQNLLGTSVTGTLTGTAGAVGPFKLQATFIRRTATRSIVVIALVPAASYMGQTLFRVDDTAGGTALAQLGDFASTQCEVFGAEVNAKVDFIWVVDDSGSMKQSQNAVGNAGALFASKVASAGLDWRVAAVTTSYFSRGTYRNFTSDIGVMKDWFASGKGTSFGTNGDANERPFESSQGYFPTILPRTSDPAQNKIRNDALVHLITLTDTNDQSGTTAAQYISFLKNFDGTATPAVMHGVICPEGVVCSSDEGRIDNPGKIQTAIRATAGVLGDIRVANDTSPAAQQQLANTIDAILSAAIGGTGHQLSKPPIAATIKIAIETGKTKGTCDTANVPRDRTNGWDIDAATRRIVFYGNCIPSAAGVKVAVSYKSWNDASPDPNGDACGGTCMAPMTCDPGQKLCVCTDCGGCGTGLTCNKVSCVCEPEIN